MKKFTLIIALIVALVALVAVPVSAVTITGNLTEPPQTIRLEWTGSTSSYSPGIPLDFKHMYIQGIENFNGLNTWIHYDNPSTGMVLFDAGAPNGVTQSMVGKLNDINGQEIFHGTIGWQRLFNALGVEQPGYQYLIIQGWNDGTLGLTGTKTIYIDTNYATLYNPYWQKISETGESYCSNAGLNVLTIRSTGGNCGPIPGRTENVKTLNFQNGYEATKPSGIGISGTLEKFFNGESYPSQGFVFDAITQGMLASQPAVSDDVFNFNVDSESIIIGVKSNTGNYLNSSILFAPVKSYTLSVSPDSGTVNDAYTALAGTSTGSFADNDAYTIICNSGQVSGSCLYNGDSPTFVRKGGNFWWQKNFTADINLSTTTFPSSVALRFTAPGTYTVEGTFFEEDGGGDTASDTVTVSSTGLTRTFTVSAQDSISGALISGATIQIKSANDTWSNQTTLTGTRQYSTRAGEIIGYGATAPDYIQSSILFTQIIGDTQRTVTLNKYIPVAAGNNTLYVYARDTRNLNGIEGALIHLSDGQTKSTPSSGLATFTVIENGTYQITVSKQGFQSLTRTMQVVGSSNAISMELTPLYATTARTLAPGETVPQPTQDTRTNAQKQDSAIKIFFDNIEWIIYGLIILCGIGMIKLAKKGW